MVSAAPKMRITRWRLLQFQKVPRIQHLWYFTKRVLTSGGAAERQGLQQGDIILAVNGKSTLGKGTLEVTKMVMTAHKPMMLTVDRYLNPGDIFNFRSQVQDLIQCSADIKSVLVAKNKTDNRLKSMATELLVGWKHKVLRDSPYKVLPSCGTTPSSSPSSNPSSHPNPSLESHLKTKF